MNASLQGVVEERLARLEGRVVIGIAGAPGAGKTTLALELLRLLRQAAGEAYAAHLPMDGFHLADAQLERLGRRDRKGAPDTFDRDGYAATLARARAAQHDVYVPGFERDLEQPIAAALVVPSAAKVVVTEGNYLLLDEWEAVRREVDEIWFVDLDDDTRRERLVARHVTFGKSLDHARSWVAAVDDPNARLIAEGRARADHIVRHTADGWRVER